MHNFGTRTGSSFIERIAGRGRGSDRLFQLLARRDFQLLKDENRKRVAEESPRGQGVMSTSMGAVENITVRSLKASLSSIAARKSHGYLHLANGDANAKDPE